MHKILGKCIAPVILAALLCSCTAAKYHIQDGYYSAEEYEFDNFGWKEYVTICVSSGKIILVEYNAFNSSGFLRSWDMNLMREMNSVFNTYPNAYTRYYGRQFLSSQNTEKIDSISGATISHHKFIRLAEAVLDSARSGSSKTCFVDMKIRTIPSSGN